MASHELRLKRLTNHSEPRVFKQIYKACEEFGAQVYRKVRLADVVDIDESWLRHQGNYALMAHFDFVICDDDHMPQFAVEYDGAGHDPRHDAKKDAICGQANLGLFRIDFLTLEKSLAEMSFLRYIVHLWFMSREFERQRREGVIPADEPFAIWGFLKPNAKDVFDSEYNFMRPAQVALERLNRRYGFAAHAHPSSAISFVSMRDADGRYAAFACIGACDRHIFGSHHMKIHIPCYGTLRNVPFGTMAFAEFVNGFAFRNLVQNVELYVKGAAHTLTNEDMIAEEIRALEASGYNMLLGGGIGGNPLSKIISMS